MSETVEVLITIPLPDDLVDEIRKVSEFINVSIHPVRKPEEVPEEVWAKVEVLYTMHLLPTREHAPNLRWVQSYLSGIEKILDDLSLIHISEPTRPY